MPTIEIKSIDVIDAAKICAAVNAVVGLIVGVLFALAGSVIASAASAIPGYGGQIGTLLGAASLASIVVTPVMYAIIGFIAGAIGALLFNFVAGRMGGLKIGTL